MKTSLYKRERGEPLVQQISTTQRNLLKRKAIFKEYSAMETTTAVQQEEASVYHQVSNIQLEDGLKMLEVLSPQSSHRVLDLGCGTGRLCKFISERVGNGGKVVGVDPDEERVRIAIAEGNGYENLQFVAGSDQTFPEDQYDIVVSTDVIHWIKDKEATLKRIYNNLRPGGKFGFTTSANGVPDILAEILHLCGPEATNAVLGSIFCEPGRFYEELATEIGFEATIIETKDRECVLPSIDDFIDLFFSVHKGKFDRYSPSLEGLREKYFGQEVCFTLYRLNIVLTKPYVQ